jgi:spore coat polysaccharide biosynthesis protein SpsF
MRIGTIVLCRYDSKRLHGKVLKKIHGETILSRIITKLKQVTSSHKIVVATSTEETDNIIIESCDQLGISSFRGDINNVAERFLGCAQYYHFDYAIRINGDNLFADPGTIDQMIRLLDVEPYDFISNVPERTFPFGMSVEIIRTEFFASILPYFNLDKYKEHVTLYLYEHEELGKRHYFYNTICPGLRRVNLAIDSENDFQLAERIYTKLSHLKGEFGLKELCTIKDFIIHEHLER